MDARTFRSQTTTTKGTALGPPWPWSDPVAALAHVGVAVLAIVILAALVVIILVAAGIIPVCGGQGGASREAYQSRGNPGGRGGSTRAVYPATLSPEQQQDFMREDLEVIARLRGQMERIDPELFKTVKIYSSAHQSYTDQKQRIYLKLRDKHGRLYPDRVLRLVLAHEAAHQMSKNEWGHGRVFTANFKKILARAAQLGIDVAQEREVPPEYIHPA